MLTFRKGMPRGTEQPYYSQNDTQFTNEHVYTVGFTCDMEAVFNGLVTS